MRTSRAFFDHDKLVVYRTGIEFVGWVGTLLDGPLSACRQSVIGQLERASTSVPLNIAEGNGKRSLVDRCRYLDIARGSALESAACLDVLAARNILDERSVDPGKALLLRIVSMLSKMIARLGGE
jgi:four helix bundle protein